MIPERATLYREFKSLHLLYLEAETESLKNKALTALGDFMWKNVPSVREAVIRELSRG